MKKRYAIIILVILVIVLALPFSVSAENYGDVSVNIEKATSENISYSFAKNAVSKTVDIFSGEQLDITTALKVPAETFSESDFALEYVAEGEGISVAKKAYSVTETPYYFAVKETATISALSVGSYNIAVVYSYDERDYFDGLTVKVVQKSVESIEISTSIGSLTKGSEIDFRLTLNGSPTLSVPMSEMNISVNGVKIDSLKGYKIGNAELLDVKVECLGKEYRKVFTVTEKVPLTYFELSKDTFSFLLRDTSGTISVYANKGARPDVSLTAKNDSITVTAVDIVESDRPDCEKYDVTVILNNETIGERIMLRVGDTVRFGTVNVIGKIETVSIKSDSSSFSVKDTAVFHAVINGIADVDTEVLWNVNGVDIDQNSSTITLTNRTSGNITVKATVGEMSGEFSYEIDISKGQIILTVIICVAVIVLCLPIIFLLKKSPKTNPKESLIKDNTAIISDLTSLKKSIEEKPSEKNVKLVTKILISLARAEKKCVEEEFDSTNKSFGSAANAMKDAKALADRLPHILKNCPKNEAILAIDNIIYSLKSCNVIIAKVIENS